MTNWRPADEARLAAIQWRSFDEPETLPPDVVKARAAEIRALLARKRAAEETPAERYESAPYDRHAANDAHWRRWERGYKRLMRYEQVQ